MSTSKTNFFTSILQTAACHARRCFCFLHTAHHHLIAPTAQCGKTAIIIGLHQRRDAKKTAIVIGLRKRRDAEKTAEERFNMLARGWLAYPVTSIHAHLPPKSGCRNHIPRLANNLYNRSSAVDSLLHNQPQVGKPTWGYNYTTALRRLPHPSKKTPIINALRQQRNAKKTAEERFHTLARGWLAYPVTPIHSQLPPKSGCRSHIPRLANNLYNRSSAVDSLLIQLTPGRQANLGLQLSNRPSAVASSIGRHPQNPPIIIGLRQRRDAKKTAEERFHTLARGWLAYPVTPMHAHLPPKSGCRNPISRLAILVLFDYFRNKMFYELHRCIIPHRFFDKRPRSHSRQRASR